jgi:prephenate dehydrogenase
MFNKICIIGPGMIGGSIAKTARQKDLCRNLVGYGRNEDIHNLIKGKEIGVLDDYFLNIEEALDSADLVIIATPVGAIESILALVKPFWNKASLYTDVGSTKLNVIVAAKKTFGEVPDNFIPSHPIAGAEQSGVIAATDDLFINKRVILTPTENNSLQAIEKIQQFWCDLGAEVYEMDAQHHDAVLAATSHLPHILAFALVDMLGHKDEQTEIFKYAASGFKDFTRIASSDPTMWVDICLANKTQILPLIEELKLELNKITDSIKNNDLEQLNNTFKYAGKARQRFLDIFDN